MGADVYVDADIDGGGKNAAINGIMGKGVSDREMELDDSSDGDDIGYYPDDDDDDDDDKPLVTK